jgi:hypothetical protein
MQMRFKKPRHATLVAYLALFVAMGGSAYAATGGNFILGHSNSADQPTGLKNTGAGAALKLGNVSGPAFTVPNHAKIHDLNADRLDGLDSSQLQPKLPPRLQFTNLSLINGWTGGCFGTGAPGVAIDAQGVVHMRGGMCTTGTSARPFILALRFRPTKDLFIAVDECNITTGRIHIEPTGDVIVTSDPTRTVDSSDAQCFTSLGGVSYTLPF